ncbi:uncharacterized protein CTRU02_207608 [Colletotrichum truncatum]|uniref:Uncharacterized protein n=1 Tax=Colletotrichum truncatum TaxID=5467 RepID=A0ACC3Z1B6_COLTU|nr:uncharacterized protein CTRU02_09289 [Colletotrichum truncatum]KAF6788969.1 hypothetical protein CTRU02_09289 [Colletotrichum truncatum]
MDGYNYGSRPLHGQSSLSPETPTSAYKTNVKRTKTKKWVEAKTQNYDGDDWGNDFDDEPDEQVPVPPLKPKMGFRQPSPSQATTANLPSNQPSAPQSEEPVSTTRPLQPTGNESRMSSSPRATAGLPPLQTQTKPQPGSAVIQTVSNDIRPPEVSGPSPMDSSAEKPSYEQLVSPQSASVGPNPGPFVGRYGHSQSIPSSVGSPRASPPPQQQLAQHQAPLFPPRKSSMSQHDTDRHSNSRSSSTHPPLVEQRPTSPPIITSSGTPSNSEALPFVRPSDIYRRLDDEKEEGQRPTELERPSLDSTGNPVSDRSASPSKAAVSGAESSEQSGGDTLARSEGGDAAQNKQQTVLKPVAERRSEYGFDGLHTHPQNHIHSPAFGNLEQGSLGVPEPSSEPQLQHPSNEEAEQQRRYSSSPRLPDLARMSLFGDDFFSNPGKFADDAPPMPPLQPPPGLASSPGNSLSKETTAAAGVEVGSSLSTSSSTPQRAESPQVPDQQDRNKLVCLPEESPANEHLEPTVSSLPSQASRPSLPGGWVTETRSVTDEQTPPATVLKKVANLDSGEVSPISDNEDEEPHSGGVLTAKEPVSIPIPIPADSQQAEASNRDADKANIGIKPLAPLNPQPSNSSSMDFVAPEKLHRESTMSTINSPSPVKESDKLREEIMRSLSPVRPTNDVNGRILGQAGEDSGPRESTYLHGVYDDYWAAGDDKPSVPDLPAKQAEQIVTSASNKDISEVPPLSPRKEAAGTPPIHGRRFSWEAGLEQVTSEPTDLEKDPLPGSQPQPSSGVTVSPSSAQEHSQSQALSLEELKEAGHSQPSSAKDETHIAVPPNSGTMSHQASQVNSVPRDQLGSEIIQPPSAVSVLTDINSAPTAQPRRVSLAEEKSMVEVSPSPVSPSPPPGVHPAVGQSSEEPTPPLASPELSQHQQHQPAAPVKITNFKEIMELPSASERIHKYNETREQFASMDSGLNNWLATLKSQHPEHANATASFAAHASNAGQPQSSPAASQPASQQPYYQQYLNASSPNVNTASASGRPPVGSVPMGSHSPSSDFKHSSGQVGAKGKGLLLAAGKAGKGLLSKGKNKLRGTGDKSDSSPPPAQSQSKAKAERRTSWGISLGTRSLPHAGSHAHSASFSESMPGPALSSQTIPEHPASPTPPPQLPQTSRISPFDALTQDNKPSAWAPPRPKTPKHPADARRNSESEPVSPVSETQSVSGPQEHNKTHDGTFGGGGDLQASTSADKNQLSCDPLKGTSLVEKEGFEMGQPEDLSTHAHSTLPAPTVLPAQTTSATKNTKIEDQYDDWVVVSPQSAASEHVYVVSPESPQLARSIQPAGTSNEIFLKEKSKPVASQDVTTDASHAYRHVQQQTQYQAHQQLPSQQQSESPQRQSSFIGLPPIRRSSTFGVNLTRRAKKRFSLDEEDDAEGQVLVSSPVRTSAGQQGPGPSSTSQIQQGEPKLSIQTAQPAQIETGLSASRKDSTISHQIISATSTQAATLATESTGVDWRVDDEKRPLDPRSSFRPGGPTPDPINTQLAAQNEGRIGGQLLGPGMRSQQGMMSPTLGGNPIHHLPPQGPWKLEESHLSEPLLPASRNRQSGGSVSPHQPFFGFDKETGVPPPTVSRQETQLPPRHKFSEVPPSSAQRYPGLFTSPPQGYPNPTSPTGPWSSYDLGQQHHPRDNTSLKRTQTGDSEVSSVEPSGDDDRGRSKYGSCFFKEIGDRLSRASSRERQNFKDEAGMPGHPVGSDERDRNSVSSIATQEIQDRQKRRSSFFLTLRGSRPSDAEKPLVQDGDGTVPSPKASPKPIFDQSQQSAAFADRKRSFLGPAANDTSINHPSLSRSSTSTAENEHASGARGPPKKRFSGFAGKVFNRTSSQQDLQLPSKPGTSHSVASSFQSHNTGAIGNQVGVPSSPIAQGRERSNTTGSGPYSLHQTGKQLQTVGEEDRGRRSSAGGFLSGLFGHRSSRNQEVQQPVQHGPYQNSQALAQVKMQQSGHQIQPSSLGPNRQIGQLPINGPAQHPFYPQLSAGHLAPGNGAQSQPVATQQDPSQSLDGARSPASHLSQPTTLIPDTKQGYGPARLGARPTSDVESGIHQDQDAPDKTAKGIDYPQIKPEHTPNRAAPPGERRHIPTSQITQGEPSPALSERSDRRQTSPSLSQVRDEPSHDVQSGGQIQTQMNPIQGIGAAQQSPSKLEGGQLQSTDSRPPPLLQAHGNAAHTPRNPGDSVSRFPDRPVSLQAPAGARPQSPGSAANRSDISQHSPTSASLRLSDASQVQPPPPTTTTTTTTPTVVGGQAPASGTFKGPSDPFVQGSVKRPDETSRQMSSFAPQGFRQQAYTLADLGPGQFSQIPSNPRQQHSLPYASGQGQQPAVLALSDQGQQGSVSKWFKSRASTQAVQSQPYQKESTTKSLFGAFKRSSKQPEPRQSQLPPQQSSQPGQGQQPPSIHIRHGQQGIPPSGPLNQRNIHPMQGPPHLMYQQQRQSPLPSAASGQRPPPQHILSNGGLDASQGGNQISQYQRMKADPAMTQVPTPPGLHPHMPQSQPYQEPQYDQVPIPRGYAAVHGEGGMAPSPYNIGHPSPPAQYPHHQISLVQQHWAQPPIAPSRPSDASIQSQQQHQHQTVQIQPQSQLHIQPVVPLMADRRISAASHLSNVSNTSHSSQLGYNSPNGGVQGYGQHRQREPSVSYLSSQDVGPNTLVNHHPDSQVDSPGNLHLSSHTPNQLDYQTVPQTEQSPPPPPPQQQQQQQQQQLNPVVPAEQYTASSQTQPKIGRGFQDSKVSDIDGDQVRGTNVAKAQLNGLSSSNIHTTTPKDVAAEPESVGDNTLRAASSATLVMAGRNQAPIPSTTAAPHLSINVQKANQEGSDDIYDSTPRLPSGPSPPSAQPVIAIKTGQSQVSDSSADEAPRNATHTNGNINGAASTTLTRGKSTRAELEDTEDERMRTMRLEAQEEKILVDPYEEKQSSGNKYRKDDDPDAPQMSATSYPGQEWNPYGAGGYEDWD